jgi:hypothetical protein
VSGEDEGRGGEVEDLGGVVRPRGSESKILSGMGKGLMADTSLRTGQG